ncbi:hypothetical protein [Vibrio crassostreae]|uniref:hypothetical protein n=1 Tax=Vibrio crassostreae TaxID=246167 RepID=UPI001B312103|nr:hypothetical protein [Vibrio crassostreae]
MKTKERPKLTFEKNLSVFAAISMIVSLIIDIYLGKLSINNAFALLFSCWVCVGSWHVLDKHERCVETSFADIYLWFLEYRK